MVFSGLAPLVTEEVIDEGNRILVRARTPQDTAACPVCGALSARVHGYHRRTVVDVPVDGRRGACEPRGRARSGSGHGWRPWPVVRGRLPHRPARGCSACGNGPAERCCARPTASDTALRVRFLEVPLNRSLPRERSKKAERQAFSAG
ncbi:transposase family protein [Streptomyces sp. PSKA30]|uniref:transposase family protein n=1 Tax=Streptomyces sp. PSKA30 TaxID=2874597 RepID=UPI0035ADC2D5